MSDASSGTPLTTRLLRRFSAHYILVMMCVTRVFAFAIGGLCIVYVNLTFNLSLHTQGHFEVAACWVILLAAVLTVWLALWETKALRHVLRSCRAGTPVELDVAVRAGARWCCFRAGTRCTRRCLIRSSRSCRCAPCCTGWTGPAFP